MKTVVLYAATLMAIKEHAENGEPFSARDITDYINMMVNMNELDIEEGYVEHDTIRGYVHEIMDNDLLTLSLGNYSFRKTYPTNSLGDSYKLYSVVFDGDIEEGDEPDDLFENLLGATATVGDDFEYSCECGSKKVNVVVADGKVNLTVE